MLLQLTLDGQTDFSDGRALIRRFSEGTSFALLELYTQGLLTDGSLLDAYVDQVTEQRQHETPTSKQTTGKKQ